MMLQDQLLSGYNKLKSGVSNILNKGLTNLSNWGQVVSQPQIRQQYYQNVVQPFANTVPQMAKQDWLQGGIVNTALKPFPKLQQSIGAPLKTAVQWGPAPFISNYAKAMAVPFNTQPLIEKAGPILGAIGQTTNPFSTMAGGALNIPIQGIINKVKKRPFLENATQSYQQGQEFTAKLNPIEKAFSPIMGPLAETVLQGKGRLAQIGQAAIKGSFPMGAYGLTEPANNDQERARNSLGNFIMGGLMSGGLKAGEIAVKIPSDVKNYLVNKIRQSDKEISPEKAGMVADRFIRDELGRFAGIKKQEPVYYGDLRESLGLPRNGDYKQGFIKPDEFLSKGKEKVNPLRSTGKFSATNVREADNPLLRGKDWQAKQSEPLPSEPLPWETPGYKTENLPKIPTDKATQERVSLTEGGLTGKPSQETRNKFADWVNARRATKVEDLVKQKEFQDLNSKGMNGIFEFQSGNKTGRYGDVKNYFDTKYNQLQQNGVKFGYKQDYLPQLWNNTPEEVNQVFGRNLGTRPSFTMDSIIKDYKTGIEAGLKPKFQNISDLAGWYEQRANKALADKGFFDYLGQNGLITPAGKAPREWVTLDPDRFPKVKVMTAEGKYQGDYKATPELATMINNYLKEPSDKILNAIANYTSRAKNITLSFGIPGTAINAHGVNILARHTLFGTGGNPVSRLLTGTKYMLHPESAVSYLNKELVTAPKAVKAGLSLSAEEHTALLNEAETFAQSLGKNWNNAFEKPLFNKMIPALKLSSFNKLVENGMAEKDAAKMVNNVYGGINWEQMGRDRNLQNILRSIILAPDWAESAIRIGGNLAKSFVSRGQVAARYRAMTATLLGSYVTSNVLNKLTSGHYMYENDPGHTFEIEVGYTQDGQKRYFRPYGTAVDMVRIPHDIILGLLKGDPSPAFRAISNRFSIPLASSMHLLTNTDYTGKPIYGRDRYGNEIPFLQSAGGIGSEALGMVGFPSFAKNAVDVATGKQGLEQGVLQGFELPFRYSGGAYSKSQKEIAKVSNLQGKELYDLNKMTSGQSALSENQMGVYKQNGIDSLKSLYDKRTTTAQDNKILKDLETAGQGNKVVGSKYYYLDDNGGAKVIDLSFQPQEPQLTGNKELDKKLISNYGSDITKKMNDIYTLYDQKKINAIEADKELTKLQSLKNSYKPKKIKITATKPTLKSLKQVTTKKTKTLKEYMREAKTMKLVKHKKITKPKIF